MSLTVASTGTSTGLATSITGTRPSATTGDLLLFVLAMENFGSYSYPTPSGMSNLTSSFFNYNQGYQAQFSLFGKYAAAGEPTAYTFPNGGFPASNMYLSMLRVSQSGLDLSHARMIRGFPSSVFNFGNTAGVAAPHSSIPVLPPDLLVYIGLYSNSSTSGASSQGVSGGWTTQYNTALFDTSTAINTGLLVATNANGAASPPTFTTSNSGDNLVVAGLAVSSAAVVPVAALASGTAYQAGRQFLAGQKLRASYTIYGPDQLLRAVDVPSGPFTVGQPLKASEA